MCLSKSGKNMKRFSLIYTVTLNNLSVIKSRNRGKKGGDGMFTLNSIISEEVLFLCVCARACVCVCDPRNVLVCLSACQFL